MKTYWKRGNLVGYKEDLKTYNDWELWICTPHATVTVVMVKESRAGGFRWVAWSEDLRIQDTEIRPKPSSLKEAKKAVRAMIFKEISLMLESMTLCFKGNIIQVKDKKASKLSSSKPA